MQDKTPNHNIGTLGPRYSYSEEAALTYFPESSITLFSNIAETLQALQSGSIDIAVLPIENAINGPVSETWDELTAIKINGNKFNESGKIEIIATFLLPINHWIGWPEELPDSTNLNDIKAVYSHPQAIQQSGLYLNTNLPQAERITVSSTSQSPEAARAHTRSVGAPAAAIANKTALINNDFRPIAPTISQDIANHTRFAVLTSSENRQKVLKSSHLSTVDIPSVTAIAIHPGRDRKGLLLELLSIISEKHECNLLSIHSRPDTKGGFIFYFELEGSSEDKSIIVCLEELKQYCTLDTGSSAQLLYFGSYQRASFGLQKLPKACVVGAKGAMGGWLVNFLRQAGLDVLCIDVDSNISERNEIRSCDIILLSVPMKNIEEACRSLKDHIKEGALIVENCSVKTRALSAISTHFPKPYETVGIHTMFGPDITGLKGKNVVISKTENSGPLALALENIFYKFGANIHYADSTEHDRIVSLLQALCQFASLGLGKVISDNHSNLESLTPFLTPNSSRILTSIKRVVSQSPGLTYDLQNENPYSKEIREALIDALNTINNEIESTDALEQRVKSLRERLG